MSRLEADLALTGSIVAMNVRTTPEFRLDPSRNEVEALKPESALGTRRNEIATGLAVGLSRVPANFAGEAAQIRKIILAKHRQS